MSCKELLQFYKKIIALLGAMSEIQDIHGEIMGFNTLYPIISKTTIYGAVIYREYIVYPKQNIILPIVSKFYWIYSRFIHYILTNKYTVR